MNDVGIVEVQVLEARGLRSADFTGSSDPYATIELGNNFSRTETLYNTLEPVWNKTLNLYNQFLLGKSNKIKLFQ